MATRTSLTRILRRGLQVSAGIAVTYLLLCLGLIFWPAPKPFAGADPISAEREEREFSAGGDRSPGAAFEEISIEARDGESLFARRYESDQATTIVFLHGIATDGQRLHNAAALLREATGAEIIAPDSRGHGRSGGTPFDVAYIGQYEDDLEDVIRWVQRETPKRRVIVAGHSMGGGVAMRYALKQDAPLPAAYLLLAPNFGEGPTQRAGEAMDPDEAREAASFVHFDVRRMIGIILLNSVGVRALDHLPIMYFNLRPEVIEYSYRAVMSAQPIRPRTSDVALQAVRSPLLVLVGSEDEVFEVANFPSFVSDNSDGEVAVLPGLTHDGLLNDPATFEVVADWYERLPSDVEQAGLIAP